MSDSLWEDGEDSSAVRTYGFKTWRVLLVLSLIILAFSVSAALVLGITTYMVMIFLIQMALFGGATAAARNRAVMLNKHFLVYQPAYGPANWIWWYEVQRAEASKVPFMNGSVPGLRFTNNTGSQVGVPLDLEGRSEIMEYVKRKLGNRACF